MTRHPSANTISQSESEANDDTTPTLTHTTVDNSDRDERLGEAIEAYLELIESGTEPPTPQDYVERFPDLKDDLRAALDGLALVQKLTGQSNGSADSQMRETRLAPGRKIAGYKIVRVLGRGGMGIVYEAVHIGLGRSVALKVLTRAASVGSQARRRFLNEAKTAAGLHHTHIVPVFDVGQEDGLCYYAMQRIEGVGLDRVLTQLRRQAKADRSVADSELPPTVSQHPDLCDDSADEATGSWQGSKEPREPHSNTNTFALASDFLVYRPPMGAAFHRWAARFGAQAAEALAHAHKERVIHRDIKPSNVLVDQKGSAWIADFGLARRLADPSQTQSGSVIGTPKYMSPEQARSGTVDARSDVYSLGATLYELISLRAPFDGKTAVELSTQILNHEPALPRAWDRTIPRDLETIVLKAMAKRPSDRYHTAQELADDLNRFLNSEPVKARRISVAGRMWRLARRRPAITAVTTVAVSAIVVVASIAYVNVARERDTSNQLQDKLRNQVRIGNINQAESIARLSDEPNRRAKGLDLVSEAVRLTPTEKERSQLRDLAVLLMSPRDISLKGTHPSGQSRGLTFLDGGRRVASLSMHEEKIALWDVQESKLINKADFPFSRALRGPLPMLDGLATDGQMIVRIGPEGNGLQYIDPTTGNSELTILNERRVSRLVGSGRGERLLTIDMHRTRDRDYQLSLWNPDRTEKPIAYWHLPDPARFFFPLMEISHDAKTLAFAGFLDDTVQVYSAETGQWISDILIEPFEVRAVAVGRDGLVAVATHLGVQLHQAHSKTRLSMLETKQTSIRRMMFSPDGGLLAIAGENREVEMWDTVTGHLIAALPLQGRAEMMAFSHEGKLFGTVSESEELTLWEISPSIGLTRSRELSGRLWSLAFRDNGMLAISSSSGVWFWNPSESGLAIKPCGVELQSRDNVGETNQNPTTNTNVGELAPEGQNAALPTAREHEDLATFDSDGRLIVMNHQSVSGRVFDTDPDAPPCSLKPEPVFLATLRPPGLGRGRGPGGSAGSGSSSTNAFPPRLIQSPDDKVFAYPANFALQVWYASEPDRVRLLPLPSGPFSEVAIGLEGERFYSIDRRDRRIEAYQWGDRGELWPLGWKRNNASDKDVQWSSSLNDLIGLTIHPNGRWLAVGRMNGSVVLLDSETGAINRMFGGKSASDQELSPAWVLKFSPDGRTLAVGGSREIRLWSIDPEGLTEPVSLVNLPAPRGGTRLMVFDKSRGWLAIGGVEDAVEVWDIQKIRGELETLGLGWSQDANSTSRTKLDDADRK